MTSEREAVARAVWDTLGPDYTFDEARAGQEKATHAEAITWVYLVADAAIAAMGAREVTVAEAARPMNTAPKDHTMVHLLIDYSDEDNPRPLEDATQSWTIGMNGLDHTGTDEWQFVGWDWSQDKFTDEVSPRCGEPIGWLPFRAFSTGQEGRG